MVGGCILFIASLENILYSYVDVTIIDEGLQNFGPFLAPMAFDQKEIIIVPWLLYHRNRGGEG